jgi:hypothetical protein
MWQALRSIRVGAIGLAFFGCYILPTVIGWLILVTVHAIAPSLTETSAVAVGLLLLWVIFLAPVCAGYLAARLSRTLPLLHGLAVSLVGCVLYLIYIGLTGNAGLLALLVVPPVLLAGLCGAWFYRYRSRGLLEL